MHGFRSSFRKSVVAVLALVVLGGIAPSAQAQELARTFALSAFGGYNVASDIFTNANSELGTASLELKNGFMWGGRLTGFTTDYTGVEFAYTRNQSDLAVKSGTLAENYDAGKLSFDQYDLNFLISQPSVNPKMWPYFTLGLGWTLTHPNVTAPGTNEPVNVKSNSLFAFNFGIGSLINVNPQLAVRLDARWRVTDTAITTSSGVYCDYWGYCWSYSSDWYNSGEFTAGLTYKLGSK